MAWGRNAEAIAAALAVDADEVRRVRVLPGRSGTSDTPDMAKAYARDADLAVRVARIEEPLEHLATREDVANALGQMETRLVKWTIGTTIAAVGATAAVVKLLL